MGMDIPLQHVLDVCVPALDARGLTVVSCVSQFFCERTNAEEKLWLDILKKQGITHELAEAISRLSGRDYKGLCKANATSDDVLRLRPEWSTEQELQSACMAAGRWLLPSSAGPPSQTLRQLRWCLPTCSLHLSRNRPDSAGRDQGFHISGSSQRQASSMEHLVSEAKENLMSDCWGFKCSHACEKTAARWAAWNWDTAVDTAEKIEACREVMSTDFGAYMLTCMLREGCELRLSMHSGGNPGTHGVELIFLGVNDCELTMRWMMRSEFSYTTNLQGLLVTLSEESNPLLPLLPSVHIPPTKWAGWM